jgi:NHLM bacteriocin system ABC transporter ATP-binding protein
MEIALNPDLSQHIFPVHGSGQIWFIEQGMVDLFLISMEDGRPKGVRRPILRVGHGNAVFALPTPAGSSFGIFAVPGPDTLVHLRSRQDLGNSEKQLIEVWMNSFRAAISGQPLALQSPEWTSLELFQQEAVSALLRQQRDTEQGEYSRLQSCAAADARSFQGVLQQFANSFRQGFASETPDVISAPPLVRACTAIGKHAGVALVVPETVLNTTAKDPIRTISRASGIRSRRLVLKGDWWKQESGPMLASREAGGLPVALLPRSGRGYSLYDPSLHETPQNAERVDAAVSATLTGVAYSFIRPLPNKKLNLKDLLVFGLYGCGRDMAAIAAAGLGASLLSLVLPFMTGIIFDTIIPGAERHQLVQAVVFLAASAATMILFTAVRSYAVLRMEGRMDFCLQTAVWDRLLKLPVPFFRNYSAGDLATRSLAINRIREMLTGDTLSAILSGIFSCTSFFLLFYYSAPLAVVAVALIAVDVVVLIVSSLLRLRYQRALSAAEGRIAGLVFEFINGIAKLRVSGVESRAFARWAAEFTSKKRQDFLARRLSNVLTFFDSIFPALASAVLFLTLAVTMDKPGGALTTGSFLAFNAAFGQLTGAVLGLASVAISLLDVVPLYERARPILETLPEVGTFKTDPGVLKGNIEVSHAFFRYGEDSPIVLNDVSIQIPAGQFVAIVGPSGSGKSTLLRLLLGFEKLQSGSIYFDGQDFAGLDAEEVRAQMGIVLQSGKLMSGDVLTNIAGSGFITVDDAWRAARIAGLEQDIKDMPMGMYTLVGEGGAGFSGGQRQRLMIARAVAGSPRILVFDEATSALDNRTQALVSSALETLQATRIVVAHRLSTVVKTDRIFVLDQGRVVQSGTYAELIDQKGLFASLAKRQLA